MLKPVVPLIASLAVMSLFAQRADAWGVEGHQVTALIAEAHLTPAARAQVADLLGKDRDGDQANISDAEIAGWADQIRRERRETSGYHFVDIPVGAAGYDAKRDGNKGENVIDAIAKYEAILKDPTQSKADRNEALKFVVHFVGDLHQPLHCAERDKDRGGNSRLCFLLDAKGKASNLHSIWDSGILRLMIQKTPINQFAAAIDKRITPAVIKTWSAGTVIDWANSSHDVAVKSVYAGVPADGPPPRLDQRYVDRAKPVISEQLAKGGIRLATVLNRDLVGPVVKTPAAARDKDVAR